MKAKWFGAVTRYYLGSVAVVLWLSASAKLVSAVGSARILYLPDAVFDVNNRLLLVVVAAVELAVSVYLVAGRNRGLQVACVAWLGANFVFYRVVHWWLRPHELCPCLGTLMSQLPIGHRTVEVLLKSIIGYMLGGSMWFMAARFTRRVEPIDEE